MLALELEREADRPFRVTKSDPIVFFSTEGPAQELLIELREPVWLWGAKHDCRQLDIRTSAHFVIVPFGIPPSEQR